MKKVLTLLLFFCCITLVAQTKYKTETVNIKCSAVVDLSEQKDDFFPVLQKLEAPSPDGDSYRSYLAATKQKMKHNPLQPVAKKHQAALGEQPNPIIVSGVETNTTPSGRPNDNDVAISNDGWLVSVVNSNIHIQNMYDETEEISQYSLQYFGEALGTYNLSYDPKVEYDPINDRFTLLFLNGYTAANTNIIMATSLSGNPLGLWALYEIQGNPFDEPDIWSDYPMIAFSEEEIFITINLIKEGVSWQEGFTQTIIWQINKDDAVMQSDSIPLQMWYDINFNGQPVRNIIPVEGGFYTKGPDKFFLSNRNFAESNDTIFMIHISGLKDDADTELSVKYGLTDLPYAMPPNGREKFGKELITNDARILGARLEIGKIHYVHNTLNPATGFVEVYHGIIENIYGETPNITGKYIGDGVHDFAYPNLAFSGQEAADEQYLIAFSYSAADTFPGTAAIFYQDDAYSDIVFVKNGEGVITYSGGNNQYRWGDYSGIQYKYDEPGTVWLSNTYGGANGAGNTWVAQLQSPDLSGGLVETNIETLEQQTAKVSPNPVTDIFEVSFEAPASDVYSMELFDATGKAVKSLLKAKATSGKNKFLFSTNPLPAGLYILKVTNVNQPAFSFDKKVIVQ